MFQCATVSLNSSLVCFWNDKALFSAEQAWWHLDTSYWFQILVGLGELQDLLELYIQGL